jgi:hypothetical protein
MKYFRFYFNIALILLFVTLFAPNGFCQNSFEGIVNYKISDDENTSFMKYYSKPDKVRIEIDSKKGEDGVAIIINSRKKDMIILASSEKTAISFPIGKMEIHRDNVKKKNKYSITRTNETKTIHGYQAMKYLANSGNEEIEAWVTEDIAPFLGFGNTSDENLGWQDLTGMDIKGFPLEIYNKTKNSSIIATSIEKISLEESLFKPPADYKHFNFKSVMKGVKSLIKNLSDLFKDLKMSNFEE